MNDLGAEFVELLQRLIHGVEMYKMSTIYLSTFVVLYLFTTIGSLIT